MSRLRSPDDADSLNPYQSLLRMRIFARLLKFRRALRWLGICLFATGAIATWWIGGALVAPANGLVGPPPSNLPVEVHELSSRSGGKLAAWYVPAGDSVATVILLHPIRANRRAMWERARLLHEAGYALVLIDLQAHGESPGEAITAGYRESQGVPAAVEFARRKNPAHRIGVVGWSLGGAAALLSSPLGIDALVLESVYPTLSEAVHDRVSISLGPLSRLVAPLLLWQLQPRLGIAPADVSPIDKIALAGCPIMILAGDRDEHTPLLESERLFATAADPKQLVVFAGAAHVDLQVYDQAKYQEHVLHFFAQHLRPTFLGCPKSTPPALANSLAQ